MEQSATPPPAGDPPSPPPPPPAAPASSGEYPVQFSVEFPDRPLNRVTTAFRFIVAIPILIVLAMVSGAAYGSGGGDDYYTYGSTWAFAGGLLMAAPAVMILFREKYPRWWFDWNLELLRFSNRVTIYAFGLMDDRYPATDEQQSVRLDYAYPDVERDLTRWMPLVKWFLAIPHYIVLVILYIGAMFAVFFAWIAILGTGRYPRGLFDYVEGVIRWTNRVTAYAHIMVTDQYPPFRLRA